MANINIQVLPFWYFNKDVENTQRTLNILNILNNNFHIKQKIKLNDSVMGLNYDKWYGCFGVQSYINLDFLNFIENKYKLFRLLNIIKCRQDRCCLERIFGAIFSREYPELLRQKSLLGNIFNYQKWGYTYDNYINDLKIGILPAPIIKIWTGR